MNYRNKPIKLGNKSSSDVILVVDEQEFFAHKKILAGKSEYFDRMFNGNFKEANEDRIELKDTDPDIFGQLMELIYTGNIRDTVAVLEKQYEGDYNVENVGKWKMEIDKFGFMSSRFKDPYDHAHIFAQDFATNFRKLVEMADRFDVIHILVKYLKKQSRLVFCPSHSRYCPVCKRTRRMNGNLHFLDH